MYDGGRVFEGCFENERRHGPGCERFAGRGRYEG